MVELAHSLHETVLWQRSCWIQAEKSAGPETKCGDLWDLLQCGNAIMNGMGCLTLCFSTPAWQAYVVPAGIVPKPGAYGACRPVEHVRMQAGLGSMQMGGSIPAASDNTSAAPFEEEEQPLLSSRSLSGVHAVVSFEDGIEHQQQGAGGDGKAAPGDGDSSGSGACPGPREFGQVRHTGSY